MASENNADPVHSESIAGPESALPVCRICFQYANEERGPLVAPCSCKGSIGLTHKSCLEQWLRQRKTDQCNVCLAKFNIRRTPAPLYKFFGVSDNRTDVMRMAVNVLSCVGDVLVLALAWTYAAKILGSQGWFAYTVIVLVLLFQSLFWLTVEGIRAWTCYEPVRRWRKINASVELLLDERATTVVEVPETRSKPEVPAGIERAPTSATRFRSATASPLRSARSLPSILTSAV
ncbi:E3 ubiquitin-protein ligase MARCHF2-like isoform X2 [Dermacentor albipictus]